MVVRCRRRPHDLGWHAFAWCFLFFAGSFDVGLGGDSGASFLLFAGAGGGVGDSLSEDDSLSDEVESAANDFLTKRTRAGRNQSRPAAMTSRAWSSGPISRATDLILETEWPWPEEPCVSEFSSELIAFLNFWAAVKKQQVIRTRIYIFRGGK
jgi:hypothetical protein